MDGISVSKYTSRPFSAPSFYLKVYLYCLYCSSGSPIIVSITEINELKCQIGNESCYVWAYSVLIGTVVDVIWRGIQSPSTAINLTLIAFTLANLYWTVNPKYFNGIIKFLTACKKGIYLAVTVFAAYSVVWVNFPVQIYLANWQAFKRFIEISYKLHRCNYIIQNKAFRRRGRFCKSYIFCEYYFRRS